MERGIMLRHFRVARRCGDRSCLPENISAAAAAADRPAILPNPAGDKSASKRPVAVKMGLNHVTSLVEEKKAKLVVIAHDVDPIEVRFAPQIFGTRPPPAGKRKHETAARAVCDWAAFFFVYRSETDRSDTGRSARFY